MQPGVQKLYPVPGLGSGGRLLGISRLQFCTGSISICHYLQVASEGTPQNLMLQDLVAASIWTNCSTWNPSFNTAGLTICWPLDQPIKECVLSTALLSCISVYFRDIAIQGSSPNPEVEAMQTCCIDFLVHLKVCSSNDLVIVRSGHSSRTLVVSQ